MLMENIKGKFNMYKKWKLVSSLLGVVISIETRKLL